MCVCVCVCVCVGIITSHRPHIFFCIPTISHRVDIGPDEWFYQLILVWWKVVLVGSSPRDCGPGGHIAGLYFYPVRSCSQWGVVIEPKFLSLFRMKTEYHTTHRVALLLENKALRLGVVWTNAVVSFMISYHRWLALVWTRLSRHKSQVVTLVGKRHFICNQITTIIM